MAGPNQTPFAIKSLERRPDGMMGVVYKDAATGEIISTNDNLYNFMEAFTKYCYDNLYEIYPEDKLFPENKLKIQIADTILNLFKETIHCFT